MNDHTPTQDGPDDDQEYKASLEAQKKKQKAMALNYVEIMRDLRRLEKIGGEMDHGVIILETLAAFGGEVQLTLLSAVVPDPAALAKARSALVKESKIIEVQEKNRKVLKLVAAA